jgi:predicted HD superfamily hydrolase involved in NAD metabolism
VIDVAGAEGLIERGVSARLLAHSRRVAETAADLASRWSGDQTDAFLAGLLHDLCRAWSPEELLRTAQHHSLTVGEVERRYPVQLLHGPVAAAELAGEGLSASALAAIALHTAGSPGMDVVARCVYVADFCEPGRRFAGAAVVRALASRSLDEAVATTVRMTMQHLLETGRLLAPVTVALYNECHGHG